MVYWTVKKTDDELEGKINVKALMTIVIPSFVGVVMMIYFLLVKFDTDRTVSAVISIFSGIFIVLMLMRSNGIKMDFKFKGLGIEAELKEDIKNVQTEVKNTKDEFVKQISIVSQNITQLNNSISSQNTLNNRIQQSVNFGDMGAVILRLVDMFEKQSREHLGIDKSVTVTDPTKQSKAKENSESFEEIRESLKKIVPETVSKEELERGDKELTTDELINEGNDEYYAGNYIKAIEFYDMVLKKEPENVIALSNKGNTFRVMEKVEDALKYYDDALKIDPNYAYALNGKGNTLDDLGKSEEAISWYDKVLEIFPNDVDALNGKGNALYHLGKYEEAISWYDKVLEISPKFVYALNGKGAALGELDKHEEEISWLDKALEIDPKYVDALTNKGNALNDLRRYQEAISYFDQALEISPKDDYALGGKGVSFAYLGNYNEAISCCDTILKEKPNDEIMLYFKACVMSILNHADEALELIARAIQKSSYLKLLAQSDKDLEKIRNDPRFQILVK